MDVKFSNLCSFTSVSSENGQVSAFGAIVDNMIIGNSEDSDDIVVMVRNFATAGEYVRVPAKYIVRLWNSGFNEFNIYVPTTYTYYLNHNPGTPRCEDKPWNVIKRSNLYTAKLRNAKVTDRLSSTLSSYYTDVKIMILSTQYEFDSVLNTSINGSSLPLYIYKDASQEGSEGVAGSMYHSFIEPSMFTEPPDIGNTNEMGYYEFNACCFGTDSQAIDIQAMAATTAYYRGNMISVVYHGNSGLDPNGRDSYVQKVRLSPDGSGEIVEGQTMIPCQFGVEPKQFMGWSQTIVDDNDLDHVEIKDGSALTPELIRNKKILNLYAVWLNVDWSQSHTEYIIKNPT